MATSYRDGPEHTLAEGSVSTALGLRIIAWAAIGSFAVSCIARVFDQLLLRLSFSNTIDHTRLVSLTVGRTTVAAVVFFVSLVTLFGVSKLLSAPREINTGPLVSRALVFLGLLAIYTPASFVASFLRARANASTAMNSYSVIVVAELVALVIHIVGYMHWLRAARLIAAWAGAPQAAVALRRASVFVLLEIVGRLSTMCGFAVQSYLPSAAMIPWLVALTVSGGLTYFVAKGNFATADALMRRTVPLAGDSGSMRESR